MAIIKRTSEKVTGHRKSGGIFGKRKKKNPYISHRNREVKSLIRARA